MAVTRRRKFSALYLLIPVLYTGIIFALVYLHFSRREPIDHLVGNIAIEGATGRDRAPRHLAVAWNGLELPFTRNTPLVAVREGQQQSAALINYATFIDGMSVSFADGLTLRARTTGAAADTLLVEVDAGAASPPPDQVRVPLSSSVPLRQVSGGPLYLTEGADGRRLLLTVAEGAALRPTNSVGTASYLELPLGAAGTAVAELRIEVLDADAGDAFELWLGRRAAAVELDPALAGRYEQLAAANWTARQRGGLSADEYAAVGASALAAAARSGEYRQMIAVMAREYNRLRGAGQLQQIPFVTTPFLGVLDDYTEEILQRDSARTDRISALLRDRRRQVFTEPELVLFVIDRGPFALLEEVIRFSLSVEPEPLSQSQALGLIDTYLQLLEQLPEQQLAGTDGLGGELRNRLTAALSTRVLTQMIPVDGGFLLTATPPQVTAGRAAVGIEMTLFTAALLERSAVALQRPVLARIGEVLEHAVLQLLRADGTLPAQVTVRGDTVIEQSGSIAPEHSYPSITDNPYLPKELPLYRALAIPGTWMFTAAELLELRASGNSWDIVLGFPANEAHYLIVQGVPPFAELQMHGIAWSSDPTFYRYSDGWIYAPETRTLVVKLRHRSPSARITLLFP